MSGSKKEFIKFIKALTEYMPGVSKHERSIWDSYYPEHKGHELRCLATVDTNARVACLDCKVVLTLSYEQVITHNTKLHFPGAELVEDAHPETFCNEVLRK